jgi:TolB protein
VQLTLWVADVESGRSTQLLTFNPTPIYLTQFLPFFDQYALSHRVWAPDSSSILLPEVQPDGSTALTVHFPDGGASIPLGGEIGFWSP